MTVPKFRAKRRGLVLDIPNARSKQVVNYSCPIHGCVWSNSPLTGVFNGTAETLSIALEHYMLATLMVSGYH